MATKAHLEGNARYLAKLANITLRMKPEEKEAIKERADNNGESVNGYIMRLIKEDMEPQSAFIITEE